MRFVSISASNLDEFYSVRVAGLIGQAKAGLTALSPDGRTPAQQLAEIKLRAESLLAEQQRVWRELRGLLREAGIEVCEPDGAVGRRCEVARRVVHGAGVPGADAARHRPGASVPVHSQHGPGDGAAAAARGGRAEHAGADAAAQPGRALRPAAGATGEPIRFVMLEDLVGLFLDRLFPGFRVTGQGTFRLIRDTDVEFEEEAEDLVRSYETALKRRRRGVAIHLGIDANMPEELRALVAAELGATPDETHIARRHARRRRSAAADRR